VDCGVSAALARAIWDLGAFQCVFFASLLLAYYDTILGLCLGGRGPAAAALMAALLSVGSTMTATIAALLKSVQIAEGHVQIGAQMPKLPLLYVD